MGRHQYFAWDEIQLDKDNLPLFKCKISKLVDELYSGWTQVRVLTHIHTCYFIIQNLLLVPVDPVIISASLAAVCPFTNFLSLYNPFPRSLHSNIEFSHSVIVEINYLYRTSSECPSDPLQVPFPHGRFPSSATCVDFLFLSKLKHHGISSC